MSYATTSTNPWLTARQRNTKRKWQKPQSSGFQSRKRQRNGLWGKVKRAFRYGRQIYNNPITQAAIHKAATYGNRVLRGITGSGAYRVPNSSYGQLLAAPVPEMRSRKESFTITNKEYLGDVQIGAEFATIKLPINPGLSQTFPWLAPIARQFSQYNLEQCVFCYKAISATAIQSTSASIGYVAACCDTDALVPQYKQKQQIENNSGANSTAPYRDMLIPLECAKNQKVTNNHYVRSQVPTNNGDLRMYDAGVFQLGAGGAPSTYVCGELWVSYTVTLLQPVSNFTSEGGDGCLHWAYDAASESSTWNKWGYPIGAKLLGKDGTNYMPPLLDSLGGGGAYADCSVADRTLIYLPPGLTGTYLLDFYYRGESGTTSTGTISIGNCSEAKIFLNQSVYMLSSGGGTATDMNIKVAIYVPNVFNQAWLRFNSGWTLPTNVNKFDLFVTKIDDATWRDKIN